MTPTNQLILVLWSAFSAWLAAMAPSVQCQTNGSPSYFLTSFDCAKAKSPTEQAICESQELARLDLEMAAAYRSRLESAGELKKNQVIESQRRWLLIRNSYDVNPYRSDPAGVLSDLAEFYRSRIAALRSLETAPLRTKLPEAYDWLRATAPEGFSKEEFSIGRAYASCEDPCQKAPSLYRWISIRGEGIGEGLGDIDTPYAQIVKRLSSDGWTMCRSASETKLSVEYFSKKDKIILVSRYYSMSVGNGIALGITASAPLPQRHAPTPSNPTVEISPGWNTYTNPDVGLKVRYPPDWSVRESGFIETPYVSFGANDRTGNFSISTRPASYPPVHGPDFAPKCMPLEFRVSGFPARKCIVESEVVGEGTCRRYVGFISVDAGLYVFSFDPDSSGSFADDSQEYHLKSLYEKILGTIEIKAPDYKPPDQLCPPTPSP